MTTTQSGKDLLLSYGWILVVVIVTLITLKLFGFFEEKPEMSECIIDSDLICKDFEIYREQNTLIMSLENNFGDDISQLYLSLPECKCQVNKSTIRQGELFSFVVNDCPLLESKSKIPFIISFSGLDTRHEISGELTGLKDRGLTSLPKLPSSLVKCKFAGK